MFFYPDEKDNYSVLQFASQAAGASGLASYVQDAAESAIKASSSLCSMAFAIMVQKAAPDHSAGEREEAISWLCAGEFWWLSAGEGSVHTGAVRWLIIQGAVPTDWAAWGGLLQVAHLLCG